MHQDTTINKGLWQQLGTSKNKVRIADEKILEKCTATPG